MNDESEEPTPGTGEEAAEIAGDLAARLARAETEAAENKDRLLRALADAENQRRRAEREREDARRYGAANLARDLVNVADNLRRALASLPEADVPDERVKGLIDGVAATERELLAAFERHGIRRVDPQPGERFDHNLHQAMFEIETADYPPGAVVQVLQTGYVMHDRLLRAAMVGVAKAVARPEEAPRVDTMA
jgi:molecular chaperone GrpE